MCQKKLKRVFEFIDLTETMTLEDFLQSVEEIKEGIYYAYPEAKEHDLTVDCEVDDYDETCATIMHFNINYSRFETDREFEIRKNSEAIIKENAIQNMYKLIDANLEEAKEYLKHKINE